MTNKQNTNNLYAPDGSKYGCPTDGNGNLSLLNTSPTGSTRQTQNSQAPDGSIYFTLTNGSGTLV